MDRLPPPGVLAIPEGSAPGAKILIRGLGLANTAVQFVVAPSGGSFRRWCVERRIPGRRALIIGPFWTRSGAQVCADRLKAGARVPALARATRWE